MGLKAYQGKGRPVIGKGKPLMNYSQPFKIDGQYGVLLHYSCKGVWEV